MNTGWTVFSQIMDFLPLRDFRKCVKRYPGLSGKTSACLLRGQRDRTEPGVSHQLFYVAGDNHRTTLKMPLAGGAILLKWIKQHLRIKAFFGTAKNAVKTQIWIAISVYVLIAIIKKQLNPDLSLYTILQILSVTLFEKISISQVLMEAGYKTENIDSSNQLMLFDL